MPDIFLSYSSDDRATVKRFAAGFERAGFSVWWDHRLNAGEDYDEMIEKALEEARAVVVLWSKKSVASRWVRAEATQADRAGKLAPAMIEICKRPIMFELKHTADLSSWTGDANDKTWQAYLASVRRLVEKGEPVAAESPNANQPRPKSRGNAALLGITAAVLIVVGGMTWTVIRTNGERVAAATSSTTAAPTGITLAVLPFVNMSSDPEQEYFSDGLSEELLNQLAQIEDLHVAGRSSSFSFKGKYEDLRVVGEKLGVGNILEGSVRKAGKQLRITAQLIDSRDGTHLWSHTYDRELDDVFAIQEEIAIAVSQALSIKLDVGAMSRAKGGTINVEAYDKYLRARALWLGLGQARVIPALDLYREAVALDPQYARGWYSLWDALGFTPSTAATRKERAEASARALAIAPDAWWSYAMRAGQFREQGQWSEAEAAARAALAAEPASEFEAGTMYAHVVTALGRYKESVKYFERARQLEPLSLGISTIVQTYYDAIGRFAEADAEYQRGKTLAGDRTISEEAALLRLWRSKNAKPGEVRAQFRVALDLDDPPNPLKQVLLDKLNDKPAARAAIREAFADPANQDEARMRTIAEYADHFDDRDLALAALRRQILDLGGNPRTLWAPWETGLRSDARFNDIVRELGIADYWRASGNWGDYCKPVGNDDFECT